MSSPIETFRERRSMEARQRKPISADVLTAYREISCTVCLSDVLHGLGLNCMTRGLDPISREMVACGPAVTMRLIASRSTEHWHDDEFAVPNLIDLAQPGNVIVLDIGGRLDAGPWGSNVSMTAKQRGLAGTVIDGVCRDTPAIASIGYPVFARGHSLRHGHGVLYSTSVVSEPVQIGTATSSPIMVAPGDLVMAAADGVCVVPAERVAEILPLYQERHEIDVEKFEGLASGRDFSEVNAKLAARTRELEGLR